MRNIVFLLVFLAPATLSAADVVTYYLFTPQNQENYTQIGPSNASSYIIPNLKTYIFIHGWRDSRNSVWYRQLKDAYFSRFNCNIIETDYSPVARQLYIIAAPLSAGVGDEIGDFILNVTRTGYPLRNFEVIGHSLGGQVAGRVGQRISERAKRKLPKIVALDPAGPLFEPPFRAIRYVLDRTDARIVLVLHTDRLAGYDFDCGTHDVYPNGGSDQPGCSQNLVDIGCSHGRSTQLYVYAIANPNSLLAARCSSYSRFLQGECNNNTIIDIGGDIRRAEQGRYYLRTRAQAPYRDIP